MNDSKRLFSVPPAHYQQAQDIAAQRSDTFKNWQAVIRLAISYGLPHIVSPPPATNTPPMNTDIRDKVRKRIRAAQQAQEKTAHGNKLDNIKFERLPCQYGGSPTCKTMGCADCTDTDVRHSAEWLETFGDIKK